MIGYNFLKMLFSCFDIGVTLASKRQLVSGC
jgi:hypothetical protein